MTDQEKNTEQKILEAASRVFLRKGMAGARMQEIADEAGINKSLLHYYYRNKDKLFISVFRLAIQDFLPGILHILNSGIPIFQKLERFIHEYMRVLIDNPFVPMFILHELQRDPDRLFQVFKDAGIEPSRFIKEFEASVKKGEVRNIDPRHLIVNVLSLCIFPIAARPMMQRVLFDNDARAYEAFLKEREAVVSEFVINAIQP
ncbi:MAG: TetR/AcrR family transcriptional regulator [Bacteroidales bacterium]|nr:TetR/AcrR family transcriptional regulator [Bacteroidales bacterium]